MFFYPSKSPAAFFFFFSFFCFSVSKAQEQLPDSKELIEKGVLKYDNNSYKEALKYYLQVPEGDTNYAAAKYEIVVSYLADSAFAQAKKSAFEGLELPDGDRRGFLLLLAHAYDYTGNTDSAIALYDSLARMNPTDYQPVFEKGVAYFQQKKYDEALELFQQSLIMNPYHYRSHVMLAKTYTMQGRLTEAYIALEMSLLCTNDASVASSAITLMDAIAKQTDEVSNAYQAKAEKYSHPLFDETDQIINARLAMNRNYKINSVMDGDNLIRDAHVIMEKLKYDKEDKNFVMQYYVPVMAEVFQKDLFDPFMLLLFSGYNIEVVEKYAKKQQNAIKDVKAIVFPYLSKIGATRTLPYPERQRTKEKYYAEADKNIFITGNFTTTNGNTDFNEGPAKIYRGGYLVAEGNYNRAGKKEGEWKYYHQSGLLRLIEHYRNGEITGEAKDFYVNGHPKSVFEYDSKGELMEEKEFSYNGVLTHLTTFRPNKEKKVISYYPNGQMEMTLVLREGKVVDGRYQAFHPNGVLEREVETSDGKLNGPFTQYYDNGQVKEKGNYRKGEKQGPFLTYYPNGKAYYNPSYDDGKLDGSYEEFDEDGKLTEKGSYRNNKRTGTEMLFDNGRQYGSIEYRNGNIAAYKFTDAAGKTVDEKNDSHLSLFHLYYPNGAKRSDVPLEDGLTEGDASFYFSTGALKEKTSYVKGLAQGRSTVYYRSGGVSNESVYAEGDRTGTYKGYFANGGLNADGWLIGGQKEGQWRFFYPNGKMEQKAFYLDNEMNGPDSNYLINGDLDFVDYYDRGYISAVKQFDPSGKLILGEQFPLGNGFYRLRYPNGITSFESDLRNGLYEGLFKKHFPDGKLMDIGYFKQNKKDSTYVSYYHNGKEHIRGRYSDNQKDGKWLYYDNAGNLEREIDYHEGETEGKDLVYAGGKLRYEFTVHHDYKQGDQFIYGDDHKTAVVLKYEDQDLTGYTYEGKDGKLLPVIPVAKGTARIATYYANGNKAAELNFRENVMEGRQTVYYSNGQLAEERNFAKSDLNGPFKRYYPDGKLQYEANYKDDELNGEEKYYSPAGEVIRTGNFVYGYSDGPLKFTDGKTGKTTTINYRNGKAVDIINQ